MTTEWSSESLRANRSQYFYERFIPHTHAGKCLIEAGGKLIEERTSEELPRAPGLLRLVNIVSPLSDAAHDRGSCARVGLESINPGVKKRDTGR